MLLQGVSCLYQAVATGSEAIVNALLLYGADANDTDKTVSETVWYQSAKHSPFLS